MKLRSDTTRVTESDLRDAEAALRLLAERHPAGEGPAPGDPYWATLLVETNRRIDDATSGKTLSLHWVARVALPGIVAILFFFIGLHYYLPNRPDPGNALAGVVSSLPVSVLDSLVVQGVRMDDPLLQSEMGSEVFRPTDEQIVEYFAAVGKTDALLRDLSEQQLDELMESLGKF